MKLKTEMKVSLRQSQKPVKHSIITLILVFLPELLFFIGGNVVFYQESLARFIDGFSIEMNELDDDLLDDEPDYLEASGSEATQTEEGEVRLALGDKVCFFGEDTVSFWGNVYNEDSTKIEENGVVLFYGEKWVNSTTGDLKSDGLLTLTSPRPYPYSASFGQVFDNGGNTALMPGLVVNNPNNVSLANDMIVEDTLFFEQGKIILNGYNLFILNGHADAIQGHNENSYVVTGEDSIGGYLIRNNVGNAEYDFPVGTDTTSYTPLRLLNKGTTDNYSVRVFSGVYERGASGQNLSDESVGKTWEIKEDVEGGSNLTMELQHNDADEGSSFNSSRHFIARYTGVVNNSEGDTISGTEWDLTSFANSGSGSTYGYITSGSAINSAVVSTRTGITKMGLFTKASFTSGGALPVELLYFNGTAKSNYNLLKWATSIEIDNYYFTLERSRDGEVYEELSRLSGAGNTTDKVDYMFEDLQPFETTYYRLRQTDFDGHQEIVANQIVRRDVINSNELNIYPNPCTTEHLHVEMPETIESGDYVEIINISGESMLKIELDVFMTDPVLRIRIDYFQRGIYVVQMKNNNTIKSKKLIIPER
jgi:hypothetical protein